MAELFRFVKYYNLPRNDVCFFFNQETWGNRETQIIGWLDIDDIDLNSEKKTVTSNPSTLGKFKHI